MTKLVFADKTEFEVNNIFGYGSDMETICIEIYDRDFVEINATFSEMNKTAIIKAYSNDTLIGTYSDYCNIKSISIDNSYYMGTDEHTKTILYLSQIYTKQKLQILSEKVNNVGNVQEQLQDSQKELEAKNKEFASAQTELSEKQNVITDKVVAIDQQINPVINIDSLSPEELQAYKIKEFSTACTTMIYAGVDVETSLGLEHFSYTENDQLNIKSTFESAKLGLPVPYHADGQDCRIFTPAEVLGIYGACELFKTYHTTYCNLMNNIIKSSTDSEFLKNMAYGDELPESKLVTLNQSMQQVQMIFETIRNELTKALEAQQSAQDASTLET